MLKENIWFSYTQNYDECSLKVLEVCYVHGLHIP